MRLDRFLTDVSVLCLKWQFDGVQNKAPEHIRVFLMKLTFTFNRNLMSLVVRKPVFGVSNQVRHKLGCTATEDG